MKTTLVFPSFQHLADFVSVADNGHIEMNLEQRSLTAIFSEKDINTAVSSFEAACA